MERDKRETMELSIEDPAFALLRIQFDGALKRAVDQMDLKNVDEATISVKVKITKDEKYIQNRPAADVLNISYKIDQQIVVKEQSDGDITELEQFEMTYDDRNNLVLQRIHDPQHKIDEYL